MFNLKRLSAAAVAAVFSLASLAHAQTPAAPAVPEAPAQAPAAPAASPIVTEFQALFQKISTKLQAMKDQPTEAALADEIKELDALIAKYAADKSNDVASVHVMKARLYLEVFEQKEKALEILHEIKTAYPQTEVAANLDQVIAAVEKQISADSLLSVGKPFPAFSQTDLTGKPLSLDNYKGKIVLIDFWATWCGPCVAELPHVKAAYEKYHSKGFEIVGISLDRDRAKLDDFIAKNSMTWTHYFDEQGKLTQEYGINAIPATFLLDKEGKIIAKDLRGDDLETELAKLLK